MTLKHKKPKGPKLWQLAIDYLSLPLGSPKTNNGKKTFEE